MHDWLYELRLFALEQLSGMRADLFLCDPHRIIVTGPTRLTGGRSTAATCGRAWRSSPRRLRPRQSRVARSRRSSAATANWSNACGLGAQVERVDGDM